MGYSDNYHKIKWSIKEADYTYRTKDRNYKKIRKKIRNVAAYEIWWVSLTPIQQIEVLNCYSGGDIKRFLDNISKSIQPDISVYRTNKIDAITNLS
jgi:hypothetical protein